MNTQQIFQSHLKYSIYSSTLIVSLETVIVLLALDGHGENRKGLANVIVSSQISTLASTKSTHPNT